MRFKSKEDLRRLYEIQDDGQELKGVIYSPEEDETEDLVFVFEKHTITIPEEGAIRVEKRYKNVSEALEAEEVIRKEDIKTSGADRRKFLHAMSKGFIP